MSTANNHHRRIVLDFDDTIASAVNRDWENAKPNQELIDKTNKLYDAGWKIDIFTARGSLSCASRAEADAKYRPGMLAWLTKHKVKFHDLSFDKPLATYYVDDKGISPVDFLKINIENLQGGMSGQGIYTDGTLVHKLDTRAHKVKAWFETVKGVNVPRIERVVGDVISMDYIKNVPRYFEKNFYVSMGLIQDALANLASNPVPDDKLQLADYLDRIVCHTQATAEGGEFYDYFYEAYRDSLTNPWLKRSFSHGDFGIANMLFTEDRKLYLVDPIPEVFGCTQLDSAKFIASLYINNYSSARIHKAKDAMLLFNNMTEAELNLLVAAEATRVLKYFPDKPFIVSIIKAHVPQ